MNLATYELFHQFAKQAAPFTSRAKLHLSESENELCKMLNAEGKLLEQERIPLRHAENELRRAFDGAARASELSRVYGVPS